MSAPPPYSPPHERIHTLPKHVWGPLLWKQLHDRPVLTGGDMSGEGAWIEEFRQTIPCSECMKHFTEYLRRWPVDFTSPETYFLWTVGVHDAVNYRRGVKRIGWRPEWGPYPVLGHDKAQ